MKLGAGTHVEDSSQLPLRELPAMALAWFKSLGSDPAARSTLLRNSLAGASAALVNLVYLITYSALMFSGETASGFPIALGAMMFGACLAGAWIAFRTTLPPLANGMDVPATVVLIAFCAGIVQTELIKGSGVDLAVTRVMMFATLSTLVCALVMYTIGAGRLARFCRFVPYSVVAGFLAATGGLLMLGGFKLATGRAFSFSTLFAPLPPGMGAQGVTAAAFVAVLILARRLIKSPLTLPLTLIAAAAVLDLVFAFVVRPPADGASWFFKGADQAVLWWPLTSLRSIDLKFVVGCLPEALVFTAITIISLVVKTAGIETSRSTTCDLDAEMRTNGAANLPVGLIGGVMTSVLISQSRLLTEAGSTSRWSGVIASGLIGLVLFAGIDLPALMPVPILAGLVLLLGWALAADALRRPFKQRDWPTLGVALAIMAVCLKWGYIPGVLGGFVVSCLLFAFSYSRIGIIRRHLTRASTASNVDHGAAANKLLADNGAAIHLFQLSGYIFFGSADTVFETVRTAIEAPSSPRLGYAVLDFSAVTGADASAIMSFVKLKGIADKQGVTLVFTGLDAKLNRAFGQDGFFSVASRHKSLPSRGEGLEWAERALLASLASGTEAKGAVGFDAWLRRELAMDVSSDKLGRYFQKRNISAAGTLYRQGDRADAIDIVMDGAVQISIRTAEGTQVRLRQMEERTVVGEMGFFRSGVRSADVAVAAPATLYTLTRPRYQQMQTEDSALAAALMAFVIRTLADRLDFANKEIAALS